MHQKEENKKKQEFCLPVCSRKPTDVLLLTRVFASLSDPSPHTDFVFNFL